MLPYPPRHRAAYGESLLGGNFGRVLRALCMTFIQYTQAGKSVQIYKLIIKCSKIDVCRKKSKSFLIALPDMYGIA